MELTRTFEEMPLIIGGHRLGMFNGRCEIRVDGRYPVVESFSIEDDKGRHVKFADIETHRLFEASILAHFADEIEDARRELDERDDRPDPYYGRLHSTELR